MDVTVNCPQSHLEILKAGDSEDNVKFANSNQLCILASTIGKIAAQINTPPEYLEDFFEKLKTLEEEWHSTQLKYQNLVKAYEKTQSLLENERSKNAVLNKRMQFIKDNQKHFHTLRQAYISMKESESHAKSVNNEHKVVQTELDVPDFLGKDYTGDIEIAERTLQKIKHLINLREEKYSDNLIISRKLQNELLNLKTENEYLQSLLEEKALELKLMSISENPVREKEQSIKEVDCMKKIIRKMYPKLRDFELSAGKYNTPCLTEDEKGFITKIVESIKKAENLESKRNKSSSRPVSPNTKPKFRRACCSQEEIHPTKGPNNKIDKKHSAVLGNRTTKVTEDANNLKSKSTRGNLARIKP